MKKIFFSLAAVLFAATTFAQGIVLEHTFNGMVFSSSNGSMYSALYGNRPVVNDFDECFYGLSGNTLTWWDETYSAHTLNIGQYNYGLESDAFSPIVAARSIFTTDNLMCFLLIKADSKGEQIEYAVFDELGNILVQISHPNLLPIATVVRAFGTYKLMLFSDNKGNGYTTYVYSLPGQGKTAAGNEIIQDAPRRGRKYVQDAQVLVEENDRTYNMSGLRVK